MKKYIFIIVGMALVFAGYLFYKDNYTQNLDKTSNVVNDKKTESENLNNSTSTLNVIGENKVIDKNKTENAGATTESNTEDKKYTLSEVAKHNTKNDCWSIVDDKVYDLSSFTEKHPGGLDTIMNMCGRDGTIMFNQVHGGQGKPMRVLSKLYMALYLK